MASDDTPEARRGDPEAPQPSRDPESSPRPRSTTGADDGRTADDAFAAPRFGAASYGTADRAEPVARDAAPTTADPHPYRAPAAGTPSSPGLAPGADPMRLPLRDASPAEAVRRFVVKYAVFTGRASRSEFWWVQLVLGILYAVLAIIGAGLVLASGHSGGGIPGHAVVLVGAVVALVSLALLVPQVSLFWRRMHDAGLSGLFTLLLLVPYLGVIAGIVLAAQRENPEGRRYDV